MSARDSQPDTRWRALLVTAGRWSHAGEWPSLASGPTSQRTYWRSCSPPCPRVERRLPITRARLALLGAWTVVLVCGAGCTSEPAYLDTAHHHWTRLHAEHQCLQMLLDRPAMALFLERDGFPWTWTVEKFAAVGGALQLRWSSDDPIAGFESDYRVSAVQRSVYLRVRQVDPDASRPQEPAEAFDVLWSRAVFELFNVENAQAYQRLVDMGRAEALTRVEWIRAAARLEHVALRKQREFYLNSWRPWAKARGVSSDARRWSVNTPDEYEAWMDLYADRTGYPWSYFGACYDALTRSSSSQDAPRAR